MSKYIVRNEMNCYSDAENMKQKHDELQKHFDAAQESIDSLIAFLEEILTQEEEWLCDETNND